MKAVGVQFNSSIKAYDFDPGNLDLKIRDLVLVETSMGKEIGKVVYVGKEISDKKIQLKEVLKLLDESDIEKLKKSRQKSLEDFSRVKGLIIRFGLDIRPLFMEYSIFDNRLDIYFAAEGRIDFRNTVRELSKALNMTVHLRQIGSRDQAKMMGGFGACGREVCCKRFLLKAGGLTREEAEKVTGARNISKMLGVCGNLKCCMTYEGLSAKARNMKEKRSIK